MKKFKFYLLLFMAVGVISCGKSLNQQGLIDLIPSDNNLRNIKSNFKNVHDLTTLVPAIEVQISIVSDATQFLSDSLKSGSLDDVTLCKYNSEDLEDAEEKWKETKSSSIEIISKVQEILSKKLERIKTIPDDELSLIKDRADSIVSLNEQLIHANSKLEESHQRFESVLVTLEKTLNYCSLTEEL